MVLRKTKLTLGLIAGVLGLGCAPNIRQHSADHAAEFTEAYYAHKNEGRRMSRGMREALKEVSVKDVKRLYLHFDGLFYTAAFDIRTFDRDFDGLPDMVIRGRWMYDKGRKVPASDFSFVCNIQYGEEYYGPDMKVHRDAPKFNCGYQGRDWVTPQYIASRLDGTDIFTTDRMRKEK